jgi:hypothetical protein
MNHILKVWMTRAVPLTAALAVLVGFAGLAQAHDDEDYDEGYAPPVQYYHDWHAGTHVGPHSGCHWAPDYGYHCGPHVGVHSGPHHDWFAVPQYHVPYYRYYGWSY